MSVKAEKLNITSKDERTRPVSTIYKKLSEIYKNEIVSISGKSSPGDIKHVKQNFDPTSPQKNDDIRLLVTTDILAEGVNLHRANIIVNYDIPWNATKILQRVGRVNRVGTKHDNAYIYNFFPTERAESEINLEKLAIAKIQAFHDTLGEDARYLTQDEEFKSHVLFDRINSKDFIEDDNKSVSSELFYLKLIRDIRDKEVTLFEKVKRLPKKARTARQDNSLNGKTLTFFRKGHLKKFFISNNKETKETDFLQAAEVLKTDKKSAKKDIPNNYHDLLRKNKEAFENSIEDNEDNETAKSITGNERIFLKLIKTLNAFKGFTEDDELYLAQLINAIEEGSINKKSISKILKETRSLNQPLKIIHIIRGHIPEKYLKNLAKREGKQTDNKKEIVLSESFI